MRFEATGSLAATLVATLVAGLVIFSACDDSQREWRMGIGGDTMLARGVEALTGMKQDPTAAFGDMVPVMRELDLMFCNLECQISDVGSRTGGGKRNWYFRAAPEMVKSLEATGVDVVTIANNHGMDYGGSALLQTISLCRDHGIVIVGGGPSLEEASAPGVIEVAGRRVAFVGLNATYPTMRAGASSPGLNAANLNPPQLFLAAAKSSWERATRVADVVLFTAHWGPNYSVAPTDRQRELARQVLDLGYAGFIGHSAHQFHGVEVYDGKPIIYDAGNFVVDFTIRHWNDRNMLFILHFRGNAVTQLEAVPIVRRGSLTRFAKGKVARDTCRHLAELSAELGTEVTLTADRRVLVPMRR